MTVRFESTPSLMSPASIPLPRKAAIRLMALLAFAVWLTPAAVTAEPTDAPPQRISGEHAPRWKNPAQLRQLAAKGDPAACFELATRILDSTEASPDFERILALLTTAAAGGVADASFRLGKLHHDGLGVPQDYAKAFAFYSEAAVDGVPEAQHNVGAMLVSARGVKRDYVEGLAWLIVAGKSGIDSSDELQVRTRLAKRPADVAAAERRASELWAGIQIQATGLAPRAATKPAPEPVPALPPPPLERPTPPKVDIKRVPIQPTIEPGKP